MSGEQPTMADMLRDLWDSGNCTGLDGWVGPGRGTVPIDREAVETRTRDVERAAAALSAAGFGPLREARAEAWEEGRDAEFKRSVLKRDIDPNPYRKDAQ